MNYLLLGVFFISSLISAEERSFSRKIFADRILYNSDSFKMEDWHLEGPGKARLVDGKLELKPIVYTEMQQAIKNREVPANNIFEDYVKHVKEYLGKYYEDTSQFVVKESGEFRGGHFNFWLKKEMPDNISISFDFETLSPSALHMIMFCASYPEDKKFFDSKKPRVGLAQEIMWTDMQQYRISFFAPHRKTANMRRAPGRNMVAKGTDPASDKPFKKSHHRVEKRGDTVTYYCNDELVITYKDDKPFGAGRIGFRVMVCAGGLYSNIKIKKLENK